MRKFLIGFLIVVPSIIWALSYDSGGGGSAGGGAANVNGTEISPTTVTASTVTANNVYTSCMTVSGSSVSFIKGAAFNVNRINTTAGNVTIFSGGAANVPNIFSDAVNNLVGIGNNSPLVTFDVNNCSGVTFMDGNTGDSCFEGDVEIHDEFYVTGTQVILGNSTTTASVILNARVILPSHATPRTSVTPGFAGAIIRNSTANELCFSTGTTVDTWVRVSTPSLACQN